MYRLSAIRRVSGIRTVSDEAVLVLAKAKKKRKYLHRFGHDTFPTCPNCVDEEEDAEHILTCCPRETYVGPNGLMEELLNKRVLWSQCSQTMAEVMIELRRVEERRRNFNLM